MQDKNVQSLDATRPRLVEIFREFVSQVWVVRIAKVIPAQRATTQIQTPSMTSV
eukprot:m.618491 g.618491  ORF g.618491 m.618491 type:complete len:54 (+) comp58188_c0_seq1:228-389(+)